MMWPLGNENECEQDHDYDSVQVMLNASPVTLINYRWNCTERVWYWAWRVLYWAWRLILMWPFRIISAQFLEELLKDLASWGSLGEECSTIDSFLGDAFGVLSCQFWSTVLQSLAQLPIKHLKILDRAVSGVWFLTGGVFKCDIADHQSVAVLCMLYKIRLNPMHPLNGALPGSYVPVWVTRGARVTYLYNCAPPCSLGLVGFKSRANGFFIYLSSWISNIIF